MDINFRQRKMERTFHSEKDLSRTFGKRMARTIAIRMAVLKEAQNLGMVPVVPPERRHQLDGDRSGQYAVDLVHPYRLIFEPNHNPIPRTDDGGVDLDQVTAITIVEVVDYH